MTMMMIEAIGVEQQSTSVSIFFGEDKRFFVKKFVGGQSIFFRIFKM